ncbi:MAG: LpqB family beta-propeller domain-containing protein, partial [Candidatus Acidiferrales bacterium]
YMSPEQAKGKSVDRRTDIWAFGCVLYEMLTGKMAFTGETVTETLASVIKSEPDWSLLPAATPPRVRELLLRCLKKDPRQRLQAIGDARIAIEEILSGARGDTSSSHTSAPQLSIPAWRRTVPWVAAALLAGALLSGLAVWKFVAPAPPFSAMHFSAVTNFAGVQAQPALSPDGRSVAFVSNRDGNYNIYVGLVQGGNLVQITRDPNLKSRPAWSPDGSTIAYARLNESGIWDVWEVPALGGTPRRMILNAADPAWSPDGHSLAYKNMADGALWISGISGENPRQAVPAQSSWADAEPRFSPDGRQLAFVLQTTGPYGELDVADVVSGKARQLTHDHALALSPAWSPDGRFIYFASSRGGTMNIWEISAAGGVPQQITAGQGDDAQLDVSSDGKRIVFSTWRENINIAQLDLGVKPEQRTVKLLTTDPARNQLVPVYSSDGKRLAYFSNLKGIEREGIWVSNADGSSPVPLVQDGRINIFPRWTPDNQRLIYLSDSDPIEFRSVPVSGGVPQTLLKVTPTSDVFDVGPDGRLLFPGPNGQVQTFDPRDNRTETLATLPVSKRGLLRWSPDGHSVAYLMRPSREDDPNAGLWVDDFKSPPRQIFHGWVGWFDRGPGNELYVLQDKPDLNAVLWKVGWNGENPTRVPAAILLINSYWENLGRNDSDYFDVSPDGRYLAFDAQTVLAANIGMIESAR